MVWARSSFVTVHTSSQPNRQASISLHACQTRSDHRRGTAVGRFLKRMFKLGLLAGVAYAAWRWFEAQRAESDLRWEPQRPPYPPEPRAQNPSPPLSPPASPVTASAPAVEAEPAPPTPG